MSAAAPEMKAEFYLAFVIQSLTERRQQHPTACVGAVATLINEVEKRP